MRWQRWGLLVAMVTATALALVILAAIRHGFSARDEPSAVEAALARRLRRLAIPGAAAQRQNPFKTTPELLLEARNHFADHCATCHANDGSGYTVVGQNLYPKTPDMRLSETQHLSDGELYYIIHNGIRFTGMPGWGGPGEDEESWKLVLFIRQLPKLAPGELEEMKRYNPQSEMERREQLEEEEFLSGRPANTETSQHHH